MILSYQSIKARLEASPPLLNPWHDKQTHTVTDWSGEQPFTLSGGLGPCGYDIHLDELLIVEPGEFYLASSLEHFVMPDDLVARVCDKSTWARRGLFVQNTVIEPGWHGYLTLELTYHGRGFGVLPAGTPIAQILYETLDAPTAFPYDGKYQNQARGPVEAR